MDGAEELFTYKVICLVDVLQPVELLHGLLPFGLRMVIPVSDPGPVKLRTQCDTIFRPIPIRSVSSYEKTESKLKKISNYLNVFPNELISGVANPPSNTRSPATLAGF